MATDPRELIAKVRDNHSHCTRPPCLELLTADALEKALDSFESGDPPRGSRLWRAELELEKARAECKRLREALEMVADAGMHGCSEAGCLWCWDTPGQIYEPARGQAHLPGCPIGKALGKDGGA